MKSVDRDFDRSGMAKHFWTLAYVIMALGAFGIFVKVLDEVRLRALSFYALAHIASLPLLFICPLVLSLQSRKYIRCALKENLVSERVANNSEYFLGMMLMIVYIAIMQFATWN
jgi:hypothetical protein